MELLKLWYDDNETLKYEVDKDTRQVDNSKETLKSISLHLSGTEGEPKITRLNIFVENGEDPHACGKALHDLAFRLINNFQKTISSDMYTIDDVYKRIGAHHLVNEISKIIDDLMFLLVKIDDNDDNAIDHWDYVYKYGAPVDDLLDSYSDGEILINTNGASEEWQCTWMSAYELPELTIVKENEEEEGK